MANLSTTPCGAKKRKTLKEGAPMSELTRRVLLYLLKNTQTWEDRAGNKDSFFNASNIDATSHAPSGATASHNEPMDNAEDYAPADQQPDSDPFRDPHKSGTKKPDVFERLKGRK